MYHVHCRCTILIDLMEDIVSEEFDNVSIASL